jgi:hypothetical protein
MSTNKFFIVGCPRSGTTLLQQALNRHSRIAIPPETGFFSFLALSRRGQRDHLQRINEDLEIDLSIPATGVQRTSDAAPLFERMARLYLERHAKADATHFGEKTPEHLSRLDRIAAVFPGVRVILIFRDGRDVALSLRGLPWTSRDIYVNFALWLYCCRLQKKAERSPRLSLLCVRYEDLVRQPEPEFRRILAFLELPYEAAVVEGKGNAAGVPPWEVRWKGRAVDEISTSRIGLWRDRLTTAEVGIMERWGGRALREGGYELASDGRQPLPWFFYPRLACRSLLWLARRPRYGQHKLLWEKRNAAVVANPVESVT